MMKYAGGKPPQNKIVNLQCIVHTNLVDGSIHVHISQYLNILSLCCLVGTIVNALLAKRKGNACALFFFFFYQLVVVTPGSPTPPFLPPSPLSHSLPPTPQLQMRGVQVAVKDVKRSVFSDS